MKIFTKHKFKETIVNKYINLIYDIHEKTNDISRLYFFLILFISVCHINAQKEIVIPKSLQNSSLVKKIKSLTDEADNLSKTGNFKQAEELYKQAYEKSKTANNDSLQIVIGNEYATQLYNHFDELSQANQLSKELMDLSAKSRHTLGFIKASIVNAAILRGEGKTFEASEIYTAAIHAIDISVPKKLTLKLYRLRGSVLESMDQIQNARKDYKTALLQIEDSLENDLKSELLLDIGRTYVETALDSTAYYSSLVLSYCEPMDVKRNCLAAYNNLAYISVLEGEPEKAKELIAQNIDENVIEENLKNDDLYWKFIHTQGSMYIALKEYDLAIEKLEISKGHAIKNKDLRTSITVLEDLSKAYEKTGDLAASLENARMIQPIMDSLDLQKIKEEVAKLKSQRELKEKEKEVISLQEEKETISLQMNKVQLISYLLGILLLIGVFIYFHRVSVNKAKFYKLNEKVNHNRLLSLQSAMNPHFLFNSFGTLQHFILKKEIKKANSYMTTLSDLIRNVFASSNSIYIRFNNEIAILKSYIELELGRFDHSFEVVFDIPKELTNNNPMIPSMILQPYVENAIIHGFSEKEGAKKLTLTFTRINAKSVQCEITDNGVGRKKVEKIQKDSKLKNKKNLSIATKNTQERLQIINKKDDQEGTIAIQDLYDNDGNALGTKVIIILPIAESNPN